MGERFLFDSLFPTLHQTHAVLNNHFPMTAERPGK
jgi:hypothetical protein